MTTKLSTTRIGDAIYLISTTDRYTTLHEGSLGIVSSIDDAGTVHVRWDNGSSLGLIPGEDQWEVIVQCTHDWYFINGDEGEMKCGHCGGYQN